MVSSVGAGPDGKSISGLSVTVITLAGALIIVSRHTDEVAEDNDTLTRINKLVGEEKDLRAKLQRGEISGDEEHTRLQTVETELDQCWDLLRQRRALRETGGDPKDAHV